MTAWGTKDTKTVAGTVSLTGNSATVTGTSLNTSVDSGQTLVIASVEYKIASVSSAGTSLTLDRVFLPATTIAAGSNGAALPQATINVASTTGFPTAGTFNVIIGGTPRTITYTGLTGTSFTGCTGGTGSLATAQAVQFNSATGVTVTANEQPSYVPTADLPSVYGISTSESQQSQNRGKGIQTPGWVKYVTYTDAQGQTRNKAETLVVFNSESGAGISGDADSTTFPDVPVITISAQPSNASVTAPATATFTVTASATNGGTLSYQWQRLDVGATGWVNVGTNSNSFTTAATSVANDNGDKYRVIVSATLGATSVTSNQVTLTVA